jgi:hypothetical protein
VVSVCKEEEEMTLQRAIRVCSLMLILFSLGIAASAQGRRGYEGRWQELGRAYVDGRNDHDRIVVNDRTSFRALQLEIRGGPIDFQRVVVHFENGADHEVNIRERIQNGRRTREIDLPGDRRRISSVEFWYSRGSWLGRPYVNLFGLSAPGRSDDNSNQDRDRGRDRDQWQQLGRSYVDGRNDHDKILVDTQDSFRALVFEVNGGTIDFQRVVVHFDNGADHRLDIRGRIQDGARTREIDLPGDRRRISSVEFWYSRGSWLGRPYVNLFGMSAPGRSDNNSDNQDRDRGRDRDQWQQLGRSYVDGRNDHDKILVDTQESFRALVFEVNGGTIDFQRVVVHFDNGADHRLDIRGSIQDGARTREIDLPGNRRRISSVEFWYSRGNWRGRPYVNLLGVSGSGGESPRDEDYGWEVLGQSQVNGRVDHDRIVVTSPGTFRALQLGIRGGTIGFERVVVHFENGDDQELQVQDRITAPGKTRVMDLSGNRRRIRSVEFWYSKEDWRSNPYVNLWGRR